MYAAVVETIGGPPGMEGFQPIRAEQGPDMGQ